MIVHRLRPADRFELLARVLEREGYPRFQCEDGTCVDVEAPDGTKRRVTKLTREAYVAKSPFASLDPELPEYIRVDISSGASAPFDSKVYPAAFLDEDLADTLLGKSGFLRSAIRKAPHLLEGLAEEPSLVLDELHLRGFRGFESARIRFSHKHSTVVIGNNGSGKTAILDAAAMLLSWVAKRIENPKSSGRRPAKDDIQNHAAEAGLTFVGRYYGSRVHWTVVERQTGTRVSSNSELTWLGHIASTQQRELSEYKGEQPLTPAPPVNLPALVYYPVNRAVLDVPKRVRRRHAFAPLETYDGALTTGDRDFRLFFEWFRERENIENEVIRDEGPDYRDRELEAVRIAVFEFTGLANLRIRRRPHQRMVVSKGDTELSVNQLSDGEKCLFALVGDLARRLALANPYSAEPLTGCGIVLIDEIELHLHPLWQREVVAKLEQTFPNCQFVITTHSPLVISQTSRESVRSIKDFQVLQQGAYVEGREANSILSDVMGVPVFPDSTAAQLERVNQFVDEGKYDEARQVLNVLATKMGDTDPEIVHQRSAISFLEEGVFEDEL